MNGITEIRKLNAQSKAEFEHAREGTFCVLRHGGVLLRSGVRSKVLDDKADVAEFLTKVKDKGVGYIKTVVKSYFPEPQY